MSPKNENRLRIGAMTLAAAGAAGLVGRPATAKPTVTDRPFTDTVYYDQPQPDGSLRGGSTRQVVTIPGRLAARPALAETIVPAMNPANRIDLVFVGDGYTADEMDVYAEHVDLQAASFFSREPFITYAPYFALHRVDVISNESGVDNDPVLGVQRDTALDMGFWCDGLERLLCIDVAAAYSYANNAPAVDLVVAVANSTKYGGSGYIASDLATVSGGNGQATQILLHEFGHALGNLADEYFDADGSHWAGGEVPEPNASVFEADEMLSRQTKWFRWIGVSDREFDGLVGAFEGARYFQFGLYRPTANSLMRNLNRPYNLPSVESLVIEMYKMVDPIDDASPVDEIYGPGDVLIVDPIDPSGHALDVQWFVDGQPIDDATETTLDLSTLVFLPGWHRVSVMVVDRIGWVRDEQARADWMTQTLDFDVWAPGGDCLGLRVGELVPGLPARIDVVGGEPGAEAVVVWSLSEGSYTDQRPGWCVSLGLELPPGRETSRIVTRGIFDADGRMTREVPVPRQASGRRILFQAAMSGACPDGCASDVVERVAQ